MYATVAELSMIAPNHKQPKFPSNDNWMMNTCMDALEFLAIKDWHMRWYVDLLLINAKCVCVIPFVWKACTPLESMSLSLTCLSLSLHAWAETYAKHPPFFLQNVFLFKINTFYYVYLCGFRGASNVEGDPKTICERWLSSSTGALGIKHRSGLVLGALTCQAISPTLKSFFLNKYQLYFTPTPPENTNSTSHQLLKFFYVP